MQTHLRLPTEGEDVRALALHARAKPGADVGAVTIGPRGLDKDPPQMAIAGLGDRPPMLPVSARVLAGHQVGEGHERGRGREAPEITDLRLDGGCRQGLEPSEAAHARHRIGEGRLRGDALELLVDPLEMGGAQVSSREMVAEGELCRGVVEPL